MKTLTERALNIINNKIREQVDCTLIAKIMFKDYHGEALKKLYALEIRRERLRLRYVNQLISKNTDPQILEELKDNKLRIEKILTQEITDTL